MCGRVSACGMRYSRTRVGAWPLARATGPTVKTSRQHETTASAYVNPSQTYPHAPVHTTTHHCTDPSQLEAGAAHALGRLQQDVPQHGAHRAEARCVHPPRCPPCPRSVFAPGVLHTRRAVGSGFDVCGVRAWCVLQCASCSVRCAVRRLVASKHTYGERKRLVDTPTRTSDRCWV